MGTVTTARAGARGEPQEARWRRRGDNVLRFVAAGPLGYATASLWTMALARLLPGDRTQVTVAVTLTAYLPCAIAIMWAYAARSGWRACRTLAGLAALAGALCWLSIRMTGRL